MMDYFFQLPDEILLAIFRNLNIKELASCSAVCTQWRNVTYEQNLWGSLYLEKEKISLYSLANLIQRGAETVTLKFSKISDPALSVVFPENFRSKLRYLDLSWTTISEKSLLVILKHTGSLLKLTLWKCQLNHEICEAICKNRDLEELDLFGCEGLNEQGIAAILNGCQRIQCLNLAYTELSTQTLDTLTSCLRPSVTSLDFLSYGRKSLLDRHIFKIVKACPNLVYLNIKCNNALTRETDYAIQNLQFLEHYYR